MHGLNFFRRRGNRGGRAGGPASQDRMASWDSRGNGRFVHIPELDRWRAAPFAMTPAPDHSSLMQRVRQLTESLNGAIDEGTGASLDPLIESWTSSWIAVVERDYLDHCAVISVHRGQARQFLTEATVKAEHEREKLEQCRLDLLASRLRLTGESASPSAPGLIDRQDQPDGEETTGRETETAVATRARVAREDWSDPHLIAGRSMWTLVFGAVLILIGAMADTIAFHNTLELVLTTETAKVAWVMAAGTTSMALVAAASLGIARAVRHRGRYLPPRHRPSRLPLVLSSVVWLGLGLAMFVIRWLGQNVNGTFSVSLTHQASSGSAHHTLWQAVFFAAIYLVSGTCTLVESERHYNPEFFAFQRLGRQYGRQTQVVARTEAARDRAEAVLEQHDGELQREDQRRIAAITDRQALGAEAANYARILMAGMMGDPAKTGITETGPVPEMSMSYSARPAIAAAVADAGPGDGTSLPMDGAAGAPA
jgi:hypothetical protein